MTTSDDTLSPHLPTETVSAYLDRALSESEAAAVEEHLAHCAACRTDLAEVGALLRKRRRRRRLVAVVPAIAAAAAAVLLVVRIPGGGPVPEQLRSDQPPGEATTIGILAPAADAVVSPDSVVFRWQAAGGDTGAALYRVTVTDERGDIVWTAETRETRIAAPSTVRLARDRSYLWYVDALLPGARSARSDLHDFRTSP
jgi:anti-sigma factor RsiW